jgi:prophage DNA circulation protein
MASISGLTEGIFAGQAGSYEERIRTGAYISPGGTRIEFQCTTVRRAFTARGTAFEFQGIDNSFVQRFGISSRRYALACIFSGPTKDLEATAFEQALTEPGLGTLEHPLYGTVPDVTPLGEVDRFDDLIEDIDVAVVNVELWTTTGTAYPKPSANIENEIWESLDQFDVELAQALAKQAKLNTIARKANAIATTKKFLNSVSDGLQKASDTVSGARRQITELQADINYAMDVLIDKPLQLVRQVVGLIRAPAKALSSIAERLAMYQRIARDLTQSALSTPADTLAAGTALQNRTVNIANDFAIADMFAQAAVSGSVEAVQQHQFTSRTEAVRAAASVTELFESVTVWREAQRQALVDVDPANIDTGESFQQLQRLVALATGRLVQISFTLFPERYLTLDRERALLDVLGELYGRVDNDAIDYLINTNNLTGSEILELPRGKRVAYYRAQ